MTLFFECKQRSLKLLVNNLQVLQILIFYFCFITKLSNQSYIYSFEELFFMEIVKLNTTILKSA